MRGTKAYLLAAAASTLVSTAAGAVDIVVTPEFGHTLVIGNALESSGANPPVQYVSDSAGKGAGYAANVISDDDSSVFFFSGAMASGSGNAALSQVGVTLNFSDLGTTKINSITSTIFESTFGFYMAPFGNNPPVCTGASLPGCLGATDGAVDFAAMGDGGLPGIFELGQAGSGFLFEVLVNGDVKRSVGGFLVMIDNGLDAPTIASGSVIDGALGDLDLLSGELPGFGQIANDGYGLLYGWGQSDFVVDFSDTPIEDSGSITYRITTGAFGDSLTGDNESSRSIISFACFADPVGRGGTRGSILPVLADPTCDDFRSDDSQKRDYVLNLGQIDEDGNFTFTAPAIPEPDTWAMLILGFGLVGLSMRRSKKPAATVNA